MATSKIRVTVPLNVEEVFNRLSDHAHLENIVDEISTSKLVTKSDASKNPNGLGAIRIVNFNGDILTEKVVAWLPFNTESSRNSNEVGYDYKVIAGKSVIADHLGIIRIFPNGINSSLIVWNIHLKIVWWATGEIAAFFVCRTMEKEISKSVKKNLR